jgi:hypothetical protein
VIVVFELVEQSRTHEQYCILQLVKRDCARPPHVTHVTVSSLYPPPKPRVRRTNEPVHGNHNQSMLTKPNSITIATRGQIILQQAQALDASAKEDYSTTRNGLRNRMSVWVRTFQLAVTHGHQVRGGRAKHTCMRRY